MIEKYINELGRIAIKEMELHIQCEKYEEKHDLYIQQASKQFEDFISEKKKLTKEMKQYMTRNNE